MGAIGEAFVRVRPDTTGFKGELTSSVKGSMAGAGKIIGAGVLGAAGVAIGGLGITLKAGMSEWVQATKATAQTEAVLKSTGGVANVTAKDVDNLATSLMKKTGIDDEAIKAGENWLLTFKNVRNETGKNNDIFNQATKAATDLAVAQARQHGGQVDLGSSSNLLGKALNDPVKGLAALTRVGVTFTAAQKEAIKKMAESGNMMGAQKAILGELNSQVKGSAEAYGKTLPGQVNILREQFNNFAGDLFARVVPQLQRLVTWTTAHMDDIEATITAVFDGVAFAITRIFVPAIRFAIRIGKEIVAWVQDNWPRIQEIALRVFNAIAPIVMSALGTLKGIVEGAVSAIQYIWQHYGDLILATVRNVFGFIKGTVQNFMEVIRGIVNVIGGLLHGDFSRVWEGIKQIFGGMAAQVLNIFRTFGTQLVIALEAAARGLLAALRGLVGRALSTAKSVGTAIKDGVVAGLVGLTLAVIAPFQRLWGWVKGAANSAYTFALSIGKKMIDGIIDGLKGLPGRVGGAIKDGLGGAVHKVGGWFHGSGEYMWTKQAIGEPMARGIVEGFVSGMAGLPTTMTAELNKAVLAGVKAKDAAIRASRAAQNATLAEALVGGGTAAGRVGLGTTFTPELNKALIHNLQTRDLSSPSSALGGLTSTTTAIATAQGARDDRALAELRNQTRLQEQIAAATSATARALGARVPTGRETADIASHAARVAAHFGF